MLIKNCMINVIFYIIILINKNIISRTSIGSQWLSKEDIEKLTVEKLSEQEVKTIYFYIHKYLINY